MIVFAFDRDGTVDVNDGPVPLELVKELSEEHEVWAVGNQKLCDEADIPGNEELMERTEGEIDYVHTNFMEAKVDKLKRLERLFPEADRYVFIDDLNFRHTKPTNWGNWRFYFPDEFMEMSFYE